MNSFVFKIVGFVVGVVFGLGLCWLVFSFEVSDGPHSAVSIHAFGISVFSASGFLAPLVPKWVYVVLSGLLGIAGVFAGARIARHDDKANRQKPSEA